MKPSRSSKAWIREHINDPFVQKAKREGYRSRASYKILEINEKDHLFKRGQSVIDLGATPGGWSQVAKQKVGAEGVVVALDILPMEELPGVTFILGDFLEASTQIRLREILTTPADLVLSDLAPNISGLALYDQARAEALWVAALEVAVKWLNQEGRFLVKVFHGPDFEPYVRLMRLYFRQVVTRKPKASRDRSSEVYLLGIGLKDEARFRWQTEQEGLNQDLGLELMSAS